MKKYYKRKGIKHKNIQNSANSNKFNYENMRKV